MLEIAGFVSGLEKAARAAEERSKRMEHAFTSAAHAIGIAFTAHQAFKFVSDIVHASAEAELAIKKLEATLKSTGNTTGKTVEELDELAKSISNTTVYTAQAVLEVEDMLAGFSNIKGDMFKPAVQAAVDLGAKLGSLAQGARIVGMAMQTPTRATDFLRRARLALSDAEKTLIAQYKEQGNLLGQQQTLQAAFTRLAGGRAAAEADTLSGSLKQLTNAFHSLFEATNTDRTKEEIQELAKMLKRDDMIKSAEALTNGIITLVGWTATMVSKYVQYLQFWYGMMADIVPALIEMFVSKGLAETLDGEMRVLQHRLEVARRELDRMGDHASKRADNLRAEIDAIEARLGDLKIARYGVPTTRVQPEATAPAEVPLTPEAIAQLEKLREEMEERIALYGKEQTEVSKLTYKLEHGLIPGINDATDARAKELLLLAETEDALAMVAGFRAEDAAAEKQRNAEAASTSSQMKEQLALMEETTEVAKLKYKIEFGSLKGINAALAERLLLEAASLDAGKAAAEIRKQEKADAEHQKDAYKSQVETFDEVIAKVSEMTALQKVNYDIAQNVYDKLLPAEIENLRVKAAASDALKEQNELLESTKRITEGLMTPLEEYNARIRELGDLLKQAQAEGTTPEEAARLMELHIRGATEAMKKLKEEGDKANETWSTFVDQMKRNMQDILSNAIETGFDKTKGNILDSFADMLKKMAAQAAAAKILDGLFDMAGTAAAGGGTMGTIAKLFQGFFGGPKAAGGPITGGKAYLVGEKGPELVVAPSDGYVIPAGDAGSGENARGVTVNIVNPPSQPTVSEGQGGGGMREIQIVFEQLWQSSMSDGKFDSSMRGRYGLKPALGGGR